jgi:hypothetical protein
MFEAYTRSLSGLIFFGSSELSVGMKLARGIFGCNHESHQYANSTNGKGIREIRPFVIFVI